MDTGVHYEWGERPDVGPRPVLWGVDVRPHLRHADADLVAAQAALLGDWAARLSEDYMNDVFPAQVQAVADLLAAERMRAISSR